MEEGSFVKLVHKTHDCVLPTLQFMTENKLAAGTQWRCNHCGRMFEWQRSSDDMRGTIPDGYYWKPEGPPLPVKQNTAKGEPPILEGKRRRELWQY